MGLIRGLIGIKPKENLSQEEGQEREEKLQKGREEEKERKFIRLYKKLEEKMTFEEICINLILQGAKKSGNIYGADGLEGYLSEIEDGEKLEQYEEIEYRIVLKALPKYYQLLEENKENLENKKKGKGSTKEEGIDTFKCGSFPEAKEFIQNPENILKRRSDNGGIKVDILDKYLKYDGEEIQKENPLIKERELEEAELENEETELELKKALAEKEKEILELQLKLQQTNSKVR